MQDEMQLFILERISEDFDMYDPDIHKWTDDLNDMVKEFT